MKTLRFGLLAALALSVPALAIAQTPLGYMVVQGQNVMDSTGTKVVNGTISFTPVTNSGVPISYQAYQAPGGVQGGQVTKTAVTALVTNGGFVIQLADTSLTNPANVCYSATVTDNVSGQSLLGAGYGCYQPAGAGSYVSSGLCTARTVSVGGYCNFDLFTPNLTALVVQQVGATGPAGPAGPAGTFNFTGSWKASTAYTAGSSYVDANTLYIVATGYTSGGSFGSTDTTNSISLGAVSPAGPAYAVQIANSTVTGPASDPSITINPTTHTFSTGGGAGCFPQISATIPCFYMQPHAAIPTAWTADVYSAAAFLASLNGASLTALSAETTRAEAAEGAETTRAEAAEATRLASSGALAAILPGATTTGAGGSEVTSLPGTLDVPQANLSELELANTYTIAAGANQIPAASTFASDTYDPVVIVTDGATQCDTTVGGGIFDVPMFSDGASWHAMVSCGGGGGGGTEGGNGGTGSVAAVQETMILSASQSTYPVVITGTGSKPGKKVLTNCATGYASGALTPSGEPDGHRYCTSGDETSGTGAGGPSYGTITLTQSGSGSISPGNGNNAGGTDAPLDITSNYGLTSYDSICAGDPTAILSTGVAGLAPPPCTANSSALLQTTTDGTYAAASTLFPTSWPTSFCSTADHLFRDGYFNIDFTKTNRLEFDDNMQCPPYYGFGMSYNVATSQFDFDPQGGKYTGHSSGASGCASQWCPMHLSPVGGGTTLSTITLVSNHWYHFRRYEHRAAMGVVGSSTVPTLFYDQLCLADVTAGATAFTCYNLVDPNNSNKQPEGYETNYTWPQAFDTQWQTYPTAVNQTTSLEVENDTLIAYKLAAGSTTGSYTEQIADIGEFDFDNSASLTANTDASAGDTTAITAVSTPAFESTVVESGAGAAQFAAAVTYYKATFPVTESSFYSRFYLNTPSLSTDASGASRIFEIVNGAGSNLFELYINDSAKTITAEDLADSATCSVTTTALTAALTTTNLNYIDVYWSAGTSSSTGAYTILFNGAAPADTNCTQTGVNTGWTGTYIGATGAWFGYITDTGSAQNWSIEMDNVGFSDASAFLGAVTQGGTTQSYQPYMPGVASDGANGEVIQKDLTVGGGLNQAAANAFAGQCTMSSATTCTLTLSQAYNSAPMCWANPAAATYTGGMAWCAASGVTVTVTAPTSNSLKWNVMTVGNPN